MILRIIKQMDTTILMSEKEFDGYYVYVRLQGIPVYHKENNDHAAYVVNKEGELQIIGEFKGCVSRSVSVVRCKKIILSDTINNISV